MKLLQLEASRYRSLREATIDFEDFNVFIGENASGKSTVLGALRFLHEGLMFRDFWAPVSARGGISNLAWRGEDANRVTMSVQCEDYAGRYNWAVTLIAGQYEFSVIEEVSQLPPDGPPVKLLSSEGSYYITQLEPGLAHPVHQVGTPAGTLRMLALMTALFEEQGHGLVAIEEPENNIHPTALGEFTELMTDLSGRIQILITTHSPFLLDFLEDPSVVCVVKHDGHKGATGTRVIRESNASGVRRALKESGFSLGEHHQVRGFGR